VLSGSGPAGACAGRIVEVGADGRVRLSLDARTAVAIHVAS
jgi:hypothetical protein